MYTPKRTPRKRTGSASKYSAPRFFPGRAQSARRRLNFSPVSRPGLLRPSAKSRIGFGFGVGTGLRRNVVDKWDAATSAKVSKTLHFDELTTIPRKGDTVGDETIINGRERDIVNLLGFSLRLCFSNASGTAIGSVRVAVISPIDRNDISVAEFFRGYDDKRSDDFTSTLDASVLSYSPINRDKHVVLWEKKFDLGPVQDDAGVVAGRLFSRTRDNYYSFQTYVPLNRQLRYTGTGAGECADKVYLVYWYDSPTAEGSATGSNFVRCQRWAAAHWKDP